MSHMWNSFWMILNTFTTKKWWNSPKPTYQKTVTAWKRPGKTTRLSDFVSSVGCKNSGSEGHPVYIGPPKNSLNKAWTHSFLSFLFKGNLHILQQTHMWNSHEGRCGDAWFLYNISDCLELRSKDCHLAQDQFGTIKQSLKFQDCNGVWCQKTLF